MGESDFDVRAQKVTMALKNFKVGGSGLTLSGPGGLSEARMAKLTAANQKPLILCPNLVTFSFYP